MIRQTVVIGLLLALVTGVCAQVVATPRVDDSADRYGDGVLFVVSLETVQSAARGDITELRVLLTRCSSPLGRIRLTIAYGRGQLEMINCAGGADLHSGTTVCDWRILDAVGGSSSSEEYAEVDIAMPAVDSAEDSLSRSYAPESYPAVIATLSFRVLTAATKAGAFAPVGFYWSDSRSNVLLSPNSEFEYWASAVFGPGESGVIPGGIPRPSGPDPECSPNGREMYVLGCVEFHNGGIQILASPPPLDVTVASLCRQRLGHDVAVELGFVKEQTSDLPGAFDLLIAYDAAALALDTVVPGSLLRDCEWEYFTYRPRVISERDNSPSGLVRLTGMADVDGVDRHSAADCAPGRVTLATLHFHIADDTSYGGRFYPLRFFWTSCEDNVLTSPSGDSRYVSNTVRERYWSLDSADVGYPTYSGAQDSCLSDNVPGRPPFARCVHFGNGGIDVLSAGDTVPAIGDLNLDGLPFEMEDISGCISYLMHGPSSLGSLWPEVIKTADINGDGSVFHVSDFLNLLNVAYQSQFLGCLVDTAASCVMPVVQDVRRHKIVLQVPDQVVGGCVYLTFQGEITRIQDSSMLDFSLCSHGENDTRFLSDPVLARGTVEYTYAGEGLLTEVQMAYGNPALVVPTVIHYVSSPPDEPTTEFALDRNYPNPFNPVTLITYSLPIGCRASIEVFSVLGQRVRTLLDTDLPAGYHHVIWDGRDTDGNRAATGIYLYRLAAGEFVQTRKMLLLK